ncbi:MAG: nucleotidyltransferase family protein [Deltaproteobacteria bacterium]|nr:nucleotidyltransferase family protein [Deltaproteobacteria bacterium]
MDFELVLSRVLEEFHREQIRYAAIGGFALGVLGVPRATADLDFLVHRDDLDKLHESLTSLGYQRYVRTENVSQYRHADTQWGSVDFVHAFRKFALAMLARAKSRPIFGGSQKVKIADPEDVIGLKAQAMVNDPNRKSQEIADIERLMELYGQKLDWGRIQEFYELFDLGEEAKQLRQRYGHAK